MIGYFVVYIWLSVIVGYAIYRYWSDRAKRAERKADSVRVVQHHLPCEVLNVEIQVTEYHVRHYPNAMMLERIVKGDIMMALAEKLEPYVYFVVEEERFSTPPYFRVRAELKLVKPIDNGNCTFSFSRTPGRHADYR